MNTDHLVAIDFETYFGTGCDIKTLGMSQYIKHPEFEVLLMSYMTSKMSKPECLVGHQAISEFFDEIRPYQQHIAMSAHNAMFDGYIASRLYNFVPGFYYCTSSMASALLQQFCGLSLAEVAKFLKVTPKIEGVLPNMRNKRWADLTAEEREVFVAYCNGDTLSHWEVLEILGNGFPEDELRIIDMVTRMFTDPLLVSDAQLATQIWRAEIAEKKRLVKELGIPKTVFTSNEQFAALLESEGYQVPMKWSEKQEKQIPAVASADIDFIAMEEDAITSGDTRLVQLIQTRKRLKSNIIETRSKAFIDRSDAPVPIGIRYCAAHTMRFGGTDKFNPQNLPNTDIRNCLCAPKGHELVIVDAAQIEARINAWLAGQEDLVNQFAEGADVYSIFASKLFGFKVTKATHYTERYIGKTCILGLGYQMGAQRLKDELKRGRGGPSMVLSLEECYSYVNTYRNQYQDITKQWFDLHMLLHTLLPTSEEVVRYRMTQFSAGEVQVPNGLSLYYPGMEVVLDEYTGKTQYFFNPYKASEPVKMFGGKMTENIVQCLARIITTGHMLELSGTYRPVLMSHDEIVLCVPAARSADALADSIDVMRRPPPWASGLPLEAEGCIAPFYTKPD